MVTEEGSLLWMSFFGGLMGTYYFCSSTNVEVLAAYLNEVWSRQFIVP